MPYHNPGVEPIAMSILDISGQTIRLSLTLTMAHILWLTDEDVFFFRGRVCLQGRGVEGSMMCRITGIIIKDVPGTYCMMAKPSASVRNAHVPLSRFLLTVTDSVVCQHEHHDGGPLPTPMTVRLQFDQSNGPQALFILPETPECLDRVRMHSSQKQQPSRP